LKEKYKKKKKKANLTLNISKPNNRPPPGFDFLSSKPAAPLPFTDTNQPAAPPWIWCLLPSASAQTQPPLPPHRSHIFFFPFPGFDFVSSKPPLTASHHTKHSSDTHRHRPLPHPPALLCTDRPPGAPSTAAAARYTKRSKNHQRLDHSGDTSNSAAT